MGVALIALSHVLGRRGVLRFPAAVSLAFAGMLALVWQLPELMEIPDGMRLPFEIAELQFFAAVSISLTLFALDVFVSQARSLARAEETLARQSAELERAAVIRQMAAIVESSNDAIIGQTIDGTVLSWNPSAAKLFGYPLETMRERGIEVLVPPDLKAEANELLQRVLKGEHIQNFETVRLSQDGHRHDVSITVSPIKDATGEISGISTIARDITERKRAEELRKLALLDELTGLNNRRGFTLLAAHQSNVAKREGKSMTLLFIDLNDLKTINDTFGHKEGDRAISDAAAILKETFRESDVVARVGGDEFCVLLTSDSPTKVDTDTPLGRLQTTIELHNATAQRPYKVSLSIGMAEYDPRSPSTIEELMQQADSRMYEQKLAKVTRCRVLIADSDPINRSRAEIALSDNYEIITAHDGAEVVRRAALERPDLILLDSTLSDLSGIDVATRLRKTPATTLIPIVMIGSAGDKFTEIESLRAGVDDYVIKPFDEEALRVRMDNLLKRAVRR